MPSSEDVFLDAARFLTRMEVDKCQLLSKRIRGFVDRHSAHLPRHYLTYVSLTWYGISLRLTKTNDATTRVDGLIDFKAKNIHDAGAFSMQRRTLPDLTHAGDVLRLVRNSKLECLIIWVNLEEISRTGFVDELNNLQICVDQFSLGRPLAERYSPISDRQTSLVHTLTSNAFSRWQCRVLFCGYVKSVTSLPSFKGIKGISFSSPDLPSDSALIERFIHAGYVADLRINVEAFTEIRASANVDFFSLLISRFISDLPLRYMELEWNFVDYLDGTRHAIEGVLTRAGFGFVGTANIQWTESKQRRAVVWRRPSDLRAVTLLASLISYTDGDRAMRLRLFNSELAIDEQQNLCIDDELRQAALNFQ